MFSKELKKLSRRELVDIIYQLKKNEQRIQEEMATLQEELQDRRIRISVAGSIAEATASITNVFSAAQMTAELYLHEISCMKEDTEKECAEKLEEANKAVARILADGEKRIAELNTRYEMDYLKWQQLQTEIRNMEETKKQNACGE